jgi:hypothetical protein
MLLLLLLSNVTEGDEGDDVIYIVHRGSVREIHGPYQGSVLRAGELYGVDNFIAAVNNLPKPTRELDRTLAAAGSKALDTYLITQVCLHTNIMQ